MQESNQLSGTIERILFYNQDTAYCVFVFKVKQTEITATGTIPNVQSGQQLVVTGQWTVHPKFGKQFVITTFQIATPATVTGLKKYLGSGLIKGIGPVYAQKLVEQFGNDVLDVIANRPDQLALVPGIGPKRISQITAAWHEQQHIAHIMTFLQNHNVSPSLAIKIYKQYGQESLAILQQNPYKIADDIWGVGFKTADKIAQNLGLASNAPERIKAGIVYAISQELNNGNLYCQLPLLKTLVIELLDLGCDDSERLLKNAFHDLHSQTKIIVITYEQQHFVTLSSYYNTERGVGQLIKRLLHAQQPLSVNIDQLYNQLRTSSGPINLNADQQHGIITCLQHPVTIITGGPGTGKTTLIKQLLMLLEQHHITYKLAAPTGRAAKRMSEGTGRPAITLHRLLEFDPSVMKFTRTEQNAVTADFIIVDEASMIDIFLAHALLKATSLTSRLLFIGDIDQLPSVGAGNFLRDLIASQVVPCIRLNHIFRQAQDSLIVVNAHRINQGQFPSSKDHNGIHDFIYIKEDDPTNVPSRLEHLLTIDLPKRGFKAHDAMVLVPMNRGAVGTQTINHHLQTVLNGTIKTGLMNHGTLFKVGDRVMQIRNNYDKLAFNGDVGTIVSIDQEEKMMQVLFDYQQISYHQTELDELVLAYAISIHKSQGSEYPVIIVLLFTQHFTLLQRNLLYTALTRAKKLCILVGQTRAIGMAVSNNKSVQRITFLKQYLTTDLVAR